MQLVLGDAVDHREKAFFVGQRGRNCPGGSGHSAPSASAEQWCPGRKDSRATTPSPARLRNCLWASRMEVALQPAL
jgi:hypothetical protein